MDLAEILDIHRGYRNLFAIYMVISNND
jgi:hypothetical protein